MDKKLKYLELLRDPRWQKKRLEILESDGWMCRMCGNTELTLNVHHIKYINGKNPWEYENRQLISLCEDCHEGESEYRIESERKLLAILRDKGFLGEDVDLLADIISSLNMAYEKHPLPSLMALQKHCTGREF